MRGRFETAVKEEKRLSLRLLGPPEASLRGHSIRFGLKKMLALLCYLAAEGGRHQRRELAELLWPQSEERHARGDLRAVLSKLRKSLGEESAHDREEQTRLLVIDGDLMAVEPTQVELDTEALEAAVSLARSETSAATSSNDAGGRRRELIGRLQGALELYRGEFMEGFSVEDAPEFELWVERERARWRRVLGELCERLSRLQSEAGQLDEAIGTARLWARHAPLEEAAHRRLMEVLSGAGESEEALLAYEGFRETLRETLSRALETEPSPRMRELAARLGEEVEHRDSLGASLIPSAATAAAALSVLDVPLVGRREEFGALVSEYQAARTGQTRVVAILGEAGIGKTRLAEEFLGWARARGADVLKGAASEGTGGLPYRPLIEAIRPRMEQERAPDDLLEDVWLSELSRLLPELKERYPDLPSPLSVEGETAKGALFEAIARLVEALASRASVVLFLDDLQWTDTATLEVLDYAGWRWAEQGTPVVMLVAARPEEAEGGSGLERWLSALGRRLPLRSLTLGTLAEGEVEGLLRRLAKPDSKAAGTLEEVGGSNGTEPELKRFGGWLAAETEGQPFYLVETLKALLEEGKILIRSRADGTTVVEVGPTLQAERSALRDLLPKSVRQVIHIRLSRLSPAASELLKAAAVLERSFDFETLVGVADLGDVEGLRGLDELIERHLLREEGGGEEEETLLLYPSPTYSFTHEKIRQVAYTEAGHARRRLLHRRAFEVLEESGAPVAQLGRHALAGGLAEPAFGYSVAAGDAAMEVFAAKDAIEHYETASKLLAEDEVRSGARQLAEPSIPRLEHLYAQLGRAYELSKEWGKARAAYETMLALGRQLGEARLEVLSLNHLAILTFPLQQEIDAPRAKALLEDARGVTEKADLEEELVETECNLADLMTLWVGDYEHSSPLARKALALARALEEERPDLVARALGTLAWVELNRGRYEESAAYAEEGAELNRELARHPAPQALLPSMGPTAMGLLASWRAATKTMEIRCLTILAADRVLQGRLREGIKIAREALDIISRELPEGAEALGLLALGIGLVEIGEYEEALKLCRRGTEVARKTSDVFLLWFNLDNLGRTYEVLLDLKEARRVHEEALKLGGPLGSQYEVVSSIRLCAVAALSEEWEEAYAHAKRAYQGSISFRTLEALHLYYYEVEALLRGGDERLAREEVHRFAERAEANERERIAYLRSLAVLSQWEGDQERAIEHLQEAQVLAENIGLPKELWQIQARVGELHERRGEDGEAAKAFSLAAQTLRTLAEKIADEELRERFLSAPQARRVLERS